MVNYNIKTFVTAIAVLLCLSFLLSIYVSGNWRLASIREAFGSCVTFVTIIAWIFVKWLWKAPIFQKWLVPFPCFSGTWIGEIYYEWDGTKQNKKIEVKIRQTFLTLQIETISNESSSISICSSFDIDEERGRNHLIYSYINEPDATLRDHSQIHYGTVKLRINEDVNTLEGTYWTDRRTIGDIVVTRETSKK